MTWRPRGSVAELAARQGAAEVLHPLGADAGVGEVDLPKVGEPLQVDQPGVGDARFGQVQDLQVGQIVRFNARGVGWATNRRGAPGCGRSVEWNGRVGQVGTISRDKTLVRVQWQGCKSLSDYLPAKFVENG